MSDYGNADPYAGTLPAYGSADIPYAPPAVDLSADVALPEPEPESEPDPELSEAQQAAADAFAADTFTTESVATDPVTAEQAAPEPAVPAATPAPEPAAAEPVAAEALPAAAVAGATAVAAPLPVDRHTSSGAPESAAATGAAIDPQALAGIDTTLTGISGQLNELLRLRARDIDLADRLYAENTRLRTGEFATAVAPLLTGLLRLHDQMTSLAAGDTASVAGMLRTQLLQILDTAGGLTLFEPRPGERFDSTRHAGAGRVTTTDPAAEGTVAKVIKPGFERADGSVIRVAQVEVHRFESR